MRLRVTVSATFQCGEVFADFGQRQRHGLHLFSVDAAASLHHVTTQVIHDQRQVAAADVRIAISIAPHCTTVADCTTLQQTAPHFTTLHNTALHRATSHCYIVPPLIQ